MTFSRRNFLLTTAAATGCGPDLAKRLNAYVYVAGQRARAISIVSLRNFKLVKEVSLNAEPVGILVKPETQRVFALTATDGVIIELDGSTGAIVRRYRLAGSAIAMRFSADKESIWVLGREPHVLTRLDLKSGRVARTIKLPYPAVDFDLNVDGTLAVAGNCLLNLSQGRVERELALESNPGTMRFRPDGKQILAAYPSTRLIAIVDVATGGLIVKLPLPLEPEQFCFTHLSGGQLFVSGRGVDAVSVIYPYQTVVAETILAGRMPGAMTIDNHDHFLFVANPETGELTVVTIAEHRSIAKISVGQQTTQILITDDNQYCLAVNHGSSDLAVIRLSKLTEGRSLSDTRSRSALLFTVIPVAEGPVSAAICPLLA